MIPNAVRLSGLDIYRDGGSLSVSFEDDAGVECTLMFPVDLVATGGRSFKRLGYKLPILQRFVARTVISPITGIERPEIDSSEVSVTWADASRILQALEHQLPGINTDYAWVFPEMLVAAEREGHVPDDRP